VTPTFVVQSGRFAVRVELFCYTPFAGMADMIVINQILANVRPEIEKTPTEFRSLIQRAWMEDAKARPNAGKIAYALSNF